MGQIRFKGFSLDEKAVRARLSMSRPSANAKRAYVRLHEMAAADMLPYMPARTGGFRERTQAANAAMTGSGQIYAGVGPMGQYLYRDRVMVDAATGRGPQVIPGVGPRFRKGARLKTTDRPLRYSAPGARSMWFEYAKARRLQAWMDEVQRLLDGRKTR